MDPSGSELQELRRLVAELTERVFRIEQGLHLPSGAAAEAASRAQIPSPPPEPKSNAPVIPSVAPSIPPSPGAISPTSHESADLESRIGSHWLNRIGIAAVLIGVSYFLKFAFDNSAYL